MALMSGLPEPLCLTPSWDCVNKAMTSSADERCLIVALSEISR